MTQRRLSTIEKLQNILGRTSLTTSLMGVTGTYWHRNILRRLVLV